MSWGKRKIGELCKIGRGSSPRPINDQRYFIDGNIPWVKIADATSSYRKIYRTKQYVNDFGASFSRKLPEGSLIIGTSGTLGLPMFLGVEGCIHDGWLYVGEFNGIDKYYLYYKLMQLKDYFYSKAYGVAIQNISTDILRETEINLPSLNIQEKISSILNSYDDLIENNLRRIELLEEAAQLLFREWFVYLRFPGHEHTKIANGVPEGWAKRNIGEICQAVGGGTPSTKRSDYWEDGNITWITPTDITKNNCLILLDSERKITEKGLSSCSAKLLPPNTILMSSRASIGFFALIDKEVCTNQGFISVIPNEEEYRMYILFNLMQRKEEIISKASGTTYKEINKKTFRELNILIPNKTLLIQFSDYADAIIKQTRILKKQTKSLKEARDILLPRLLNGDIAV